ncbi:MAG: hypothetical protein WAN65_04675 [Candidatus Sulfotelmatobacter sp.]
MRHLGQEREVTTDQAMLDKRILRVLFRQGRQTEGQLGNKCSVKMNTEPWKEAMARLESWGFIAIEPTGWGNNRAVALTEEGKSWGEELACIANVEVLEQVK